MVAAFRPMLAATVEPDTDLRRLPYPLLASPKLDGIRAVVRNGVVLSRSLKPIPNKWVQRLFGNEDLEGLDGELIVGQPSAPDVFAKTSSGVMSVEGEPDVRFWVFDCLAGSSFGFENRLEDAKQAVRRGPGQVSVVAHKLVHDEAELLAYEAANLLAGYEGVMLRDPNGTYKFGRSTLKEAGLLKLKRFSDSEAEVIGFVEQLHNANEATVNKLGYQERSSKKAGMVGAGKLGALQVRDVKTGVEFEIGTGFNDEQRQAIWASQKTYRGRLVKYKFLAHGVVDKPRHPVFLGFRDRRDM